jgi:hypothetical protein
MPIITLVDTLGIQQHVFATNRMKDALGGSAQVEQLKDWVKQFCPADDVLAVAGGNALLKFADEAQARKAIASLSRSVIENAPGLEIAVVHEPYQHGGLAKAIRSSQRKLQEIKLDRRPNVPLLNLSVTAACHETKQPATAFDQDRHPIAHGLYQRRQQTNPQKWKDLLPPDAASFSREGGPACSLEYPIELDDLGRTEDDRSLIGVVHVDGNGIGRKIQNWLTEQEKDETEDDALIAKYQNMSSRLDQLAREAFRKVVQRVVDGIAFDPPRNGTPGNGYVIQSPRLSRSFKLKVAENRLPHELNLPVRPLILGGDDLTFVCDGRLALDLAATALAVFERATVPELGQMSASAGVAICRAHAPILRVYEWAERLCASAKKTARGTGGDEFCAIDWHIGYSSPTDSLDQVRRRQYQTANQQSLTCRPYRLGSDHKPGTWRWLSDTVLGVGGQGFHSPLWSERRSKIKALRDLARDGGKAVQRGIESWLVTTPDLKLPDGIPPSGLLVSGTPLLDAIELLDIHWSLE